MMNIFLEDGFAIQQGTGIGQHTLNLFHCLRKLPEIDNIQVIEKTFLSKVPSAVLRRALYIAWLNSGLQLSLKRKNVDIIHFTNYLIPTLRLSDVKYVVTIHDMTAWKFPQTLPPSYLSYIKRTIYHAAMTADLILTVSDTIKREIIQLLAVSSERICTVYNGIAKEFWKTPKRSVSELSSIKNKFGIKKEFLLFVGTIEYRKNLLTLVKAFKKVRNYKDLQLILIGRPGYGYSELIKYLEVNNLNDEVILTGYISEEEKIALYDLAAVFAYPSLYEGFGMPLVEAMIRKVPIVASKISSTEEVAGEAAVYYNDPFDYEILAERILELVENVTLQKVLVKNGRKRAQEFSQARISKRYLKAYQRVLGENK